MTSKEQIEKALTDLDQAWPADPLSTLETFDRAVRVMDLRIRLLGLHIGATRGEQ